MVNFPLPTFAQAPLDGHGLPTDSPSHPNVALMLEKWQPWQPVYGQADDDLWYVHGDEAGGKSSWLKRLANDANNCFDSDLLRAYTGRWREVATSFDSPQAAGINLETASRLIVGLGGESTLETSIHLHRPGGFPIIPGSALKGLCFFICLASLAGELGVSGVATDTANQPWNDNPRDPLPTGLHTLATLVRGLPAEQAQALQRLAADVQGFPLATLADVDAHPSVQRMRSMFGTANAIGDLVFFDGIPGANQKLLEADVLTPHFGAYYMNTSAPSDDLEPVPTVFLVVPADVRFQFAVGVRRGLHSHSDPRALPYARDSVALARKWLTFALREVGVGAKTNAGYGRFKRPGAPA